MRYRVATIVLFVLAGFGLARAGSLLVSPVRVDLTEKRTNATVNITNSAAEPITVQLHAVAWRTEGLEETYSDTNDVMVNPPVFTLAAGQKQVIRLGLRFRQHIDTERAYRLVVEEVPKAPQPGIIATILRITLPIFQVPLQPVVSKLIWQASFVPDGAVKLSVRNNGTAHDRVREFVIEAGKTRIKQSPFAYVLPGDQREFVVRDERLQGIDFFALAVVSETGQTQEEFFAKR